MTEKQNQRAGDASQQFQASRDLVIHQGLDVAAVREIYDARTELLRHELTIHAESLVNERISELRAHLVQRVTEEPGMLSAFADPDFQFNLLEAQRSAARSGAPEDYQLLVDLLDRRAQSKNTPRLRMATRKALETVSQIPKSHVSALTVLFYITRLSPTRARLSDQVKSLSDHLEPFTRELPDGDVWLVDLAVLDCLHVGVGRLSTLKPPEQIVAATSEGLVCKGMDTDAAAKARGILDGLQPGTASKAVVEHDYVEGNFRLLCQNGKDFRNRIDRVFDAVGTPADEREPTVTELLELNETSVRMPKADETVRAEMERHPPLALILDWWKNYPAVQFTSVGTVIAHANFRRAQADITLPPLDDLL